MTDLDAAMEQALALVDSLEPASEVEEQVEDQQELGWEVDDEEGATVFSDELNCLHTTLPSGLVIGWDTCGCGTSVLSCGHQPIQMPRYVLKMREQDQRVLDDLEASLKDAERERVSTTTTESGSSLPKPQRPKKKIVKRPR